MKGIYLTNFAVKGIKTIDEWVSLSFYKKTIARDINTQEYNIKGIYGMNGSGKSGIVTAVDILKNVLMNPGYLNNPIVQKNLHEIINKKMSELCIEVEFISNLAEPILHLGYSLTLARDAVGKYVISYEKLSIKKAKDNEMIVCEIRDGEFDFVVDEETDIFAQEFLKKTANLLSANSICSLLMEKVLISEEIGCKKDESTFYLMLGMLWLFSTKLYICMEQSDDHREHIAYTAFDYVDNGNFNISNLMKSFVHSDRFNLKIITGTKNIVPIDKYENFKETVNKLSGFIRIFKSDLLGIEIDSKINKDVYMCDLIMVYDSYKIHAEYESTGIKKLIRLYAYLKKMVEGEIVFIDEFDSNLHDVYLCALLEYLMEYGEGQICFTTHNVGPMDILKRNKKSIDFLSVDHKIYSWKTNGNYSPSKLYRSGMIEGSPFNVDSIDFIGVFDSGEEDK
ncbi:MAG: hypothetical protein UF228_11635 [Lachnospiraceae bacterium]|nr:hypothetical protein [Lachnospiraceae bacterium]